MSGNEKLNGSRESYEAPKAVVRMFSTSPVMSSYQGNAGEGNEGQGNFWDNP